MPTPTRKQTTRKPLITLLTDFGLQDHFVGVMKGVIAGIAPGAEVIDITHAVEPFNVRQARWLLEQSRRYFPPKTVHLVVVDPGVGSERRALAVEAAGQVFIGPDNGVLTDALNEPKSRAREITSLKYRLKNASSTFHGRDIFAPAAAHVAAGAAVSKLGAAVHDAMRLSGGTPVRTGKRLFSGEVIHVDRFGNLITNLMVSNFPEIRTRGFILRAGLEIFDALMPSYAAASVGEPVVVIGSCGTLEIAVNQGRADKRLGVVTGSPVELELL